MPDEGNLKNKTAYIAYLSLFAVYISVNCLWDIFYMRLAYLSGQWHTKAFLILIIAILSRLFMIFFLARKKSKFYLFGGINFFLYITYLKQLPYSAKSLLFFIGNIEQSSGKFTFIFFVANFVLSYVSFSNHFRDAFGFPLDKKKAVDSKKGAEMFRARQKHDSNVCAPCEPLLNDDNTPDE